MFPRVVSFVGALVAVGVVHLVAQHEGLLSRWGEGARDPDQHLGYGELFFYGLCLVFGVLSTLGFVRAFRSEVESTFGKLGAWFERGGVALPAVLAGLLAMTLSLLHGGSWFTDDEQAYLFQMLSYRELKLQVPALVPEGLFHHPFVIVTEIRDGVSYWASTYPPIQPLLMTLSSFLGTPLLSQWLCVAGITYHTGKLAEELTGRGACGRLASWLVATSPMLVGLGSTYHTAIASTFFSVLCARGMFRLWRDVRPSHAALTALPMGLAFLTRGAEGTLMSLVACALMMSLFLRAPRERWPSVLAFGAVGLCALTAYAAFNYATTGSPTLGPYGVWEQQMGTVMGFGSRMMYGRSHTPEMGLVQTVSALVRLNSWAFGFPFGLALALASTFFARSPVVQERVPKRAWVIWGLVLLSLAQLAFYSRLAFGSVHDFGSAYHVWHVPWLAVLIGLALDGWLRSEASTEAEPSRTLGWSRWATALVLTGVCLFWPMQLQRWQVVSDIVNAPVRAAEDAAQGQKAIVL